MPRYQHTWDVQIVLNHFKTLERTEDLSLKDLTKQTVCFAFVGHCSESSYSTHD